MKKRSCFTLIVLLAGTILPAQGATQDAAQTVPQRIIAAAERPGAVYKVGEPIRFQVWLVQPKEKKFKDPDLKDAEIISGETLNYKLTGDGGFRKEGSVVTGNEPAVIECALTRPGFVLLELTSARDKKIVRHAGAGIEPEKIVSGTTMPADFESYWQERIRKMRERTPEITVQDITRRYPRVYQESVRIYDVRIADGEINATGILTIPRWTGKEKLPAIITFGGASWLGAQARFSEAVARGAMIFHMNIHDTINTVPEAMKKELRARPDIRDYQFNNLLEREKYMPGKIFLRIIRSLDYLKSRPEWNGKDLIATGPSFGGCQSIVAAALDKDVTLCCPGGPAMCDHLGSRNNQINGWPQLLKRYQDTPENAKLAAENSAYFDSANMARLIRCPVGFAVGFIDETCPPTSVYAAYNNVPSGNKRMIHGTRAAHGDSLKPEEPGAFSSALTPLYREICNGTEMLTNGSFRYRDFADGKFIPYAWPAIGGVAVVEGEPENDSCFVRLSPGTEIRQNVFNIPGTECKVRLTGQLRGKGALTVRLDDSGAPFVTPAGEDWTTFEHEFVMPKGLRGHLLKMQSGDDSLELKDLSLKY